MDQNNQKGFTLIELLIAVVILGILVALAAPSFFGTLEDRKLKGAGENLYVDMIFAKTESIKRNETIRISAIGTGDTWCYGLSEVTACNCLTNSPACTIDSIPKVVSSVDYPGVEVLASSTLAGSSVSFTPLRGFTNGGHLQFSVSTGKNFGASVSPLGRVRPCSGTGSWGYSAC